MRCYSSRCRDNPILAPNQFGVAQPLRPKDLDRRVTRQGIYPSLPPSIGIPWSEYVEVQIDQLLSHLLLKPLSQIMQGILLGE